jgi:hypothetical protein
MPITRKFKALMPLSNKIKNNKKIYGFDIETFQTPDDGFIKQEFLCGSVYGNNTCEFFRDKSDMADYLLSRKMHSAMIYATNLEFDFMHVFKDDKRIKQFKLIDRHGIIYAKYNHDKIHRTEFIDTWNYSGKVSLEKVGNMLNIEKMQHPKAFKRIPSDYDEWEEMKAYNINDSMITYNFAEFMREFCNNMKCKLKITLASLGLDYWRRNFQKQPLFQEPRFMIEKHYNAFHGGRTEVFRRGRCGQAFYYDYNSHYPARCYYGVDGKGSYPNPSTAGYIRDSCIDYIMNYDGISSVDIFAPYLHIPLLGTQVSDKFIFPVGNFSGWFTHIELRKALSLGYEIKKVNESIYYLESFIPFRGCVKELYSLRKKYSEEGNELMKFMIKIIMNSGLFGKFGQKINTKTEIYMTSDLVADEFGRCTIHKDDKIIPLHDFVMRGEFIFDRIKNPSRIPVFIHPILASYTTAMSRIRLFEDLSLYPEEVIYTDTDSIVISKKRFSDSSELGELKLENIISDGMFIKPKHYSIITSEKEYFKVKGIGRQANDKNIFEGIIDGKPVNIERFTKLKESYIRDIPFSSIISFVKLLGIEDDKRIWDKPFNRNELQESAPIVL